MAVSFEQIALELAKSLAPLQRRLAAGDVAGLFVDLGMDVPPAVLAAGNVANALATAVTAASNVGSLVPPLATAIADEDVPQLLTLAPQAVTAASAVVTAIDGLGQALNAAGGAMGGAVGADLSAFAGELPRRLFDYLVVTHMEGHLPAFARVAALLGIVQLDAVPADPLKPHLPAHTVRTLHLGRVATLLSDPARLLKDVYHWGDAVYDDRAFRALLARVRDLLVQLGALVSLDLPAPPALPELHFPMGLVRPLPAVNPPGLEIALTAAVPASFATEIPLAGDAWVMRLEGRGGAQVGAALQIVPPGRLEATAPVAGASGDVAVRVSRRTTEPPLVLLGQAGKTRLEARQLRAAIGAVFSVGSGGVTGDVFVEAAVEGGLLVLDLSSADSFITSLLPAGGFQATFDVGLRWSGASGLSFTGAGGLEIEIPLHLALGPVRVDGLALGLSPDAGTQSVALVAAVSATGTLGPFTATIDHVGIRIRARSTPNNAGNVGPIDLTFAFEPPRGIGLAIDAGPISGGGFLEIDEPNHRYAGMLELEFLGIGITAIGLIDTRLPGGEEGFALLVILTANFPPIQLSFGFTLTGIGGLLGVNRTVNVPALQSGIRTGAANSIMFPQDPIANAPRIISDLRAIFPPAAGQYLFGPMLQLGWGTPTLIKASLGLIIELPDPVRIVILGQLSAALPTEEVPIVELHLDVLGVIDFGQKLLSIDASLHDSHVALYNVYGDMAMRLSWGDPPTFALSIGGLHPRFTPPPAFPQLRRCTIELGLNGNPRLSSQSYLAITSNTFQVGASIELYAAAAGFNIRGWMGFDALIKFVPFSFVVGFSAGVELRRGSSVIAGIHLDANLSGPSPWRAWGDASISLLFFSVTVGFDVTFGEARTNALAAVRVWNELEKAIKEPRNWRSVLGASAIRVVALTGDSDRWLDPVGGLGFEQKVVPLNRAISRFGEAPVDGPNRFDVTAVKVGNAALAGWSAEKDYFAPAHFETLTDDQKLSRPSFELMDAGVEVGADTVAVGAAMKTDVTFETIIVDDPWDGRRVDAYRLPLGHQLAHLETGGVTRALRETAGIAKFADPARVQSVGLGDQAFVVASTRDLATRHDITAAAVPAWQAEALLRAHVAANPDDARGLQIVAAHEVGA